MARYVIFDCDGVLVDSEDLSRESTIMTLKEYGLNITKKQLIKYTGTALHEMIETLAKKFGKRLPVHEVVMKRTKIYVELANDSVHIHPSAIRLIAALKKKGIKIALASSGRIEKVRANLREIDINRTFDAIVSGQEVKKSKPDPHIFLLAAKKLKAEPVQCVVVEDSINGIQAAKNAGMMCVAVQTSFPKEKLYMADVIVKDIGEVSVQMLMNL